MFSEVKAEIIELVSNVVFVRNLSLTFAIAIAICSGLAELQSQNSVSGDRQSMVNISHSSSLKIVMRK